MGSGGQAVPQQQTGVQQAGNSQNSQHSMKAFEQQVGIHLAVQLHEAAQELLRHLGVRSGFKQGVDAGRFLG